MLAAIFESIPSQEQLRKGSAIDKGFKARRRLAFSLDGLGCLEWPRWSNGNGLSLFPPHPKFGLEWSCRQVRPFVRPFQLSKTCVRPYELSNRVMRPFTWPRHP